MLGPLMMVWFLRCWKSDFGRWATGSWSMARPSTNHAHGNCRRTAIRRESGESFWQLRNFIKLYDEHHQCAWVRILKKQVTQLSLQVHEDIKQDIKQQVNLRDQALNQDLRGIAIFKSLRKWSIRKHIPCSTSLYDVRNVQQYCRDDKRISNRKKNRKRKFEFEQPLQKENARTSTTPVAT